jgi:exosortase
MRNGFFLAFIIMGLVIFSGPLKELIGLSHQEALYSHIILIPLISLYLIYSRRKTIFSSPTYSYKIGIPFVATGVLFYWIVEHYSGALNQNDYLCFAMVAAIMWLVGGFIFFYGVRTFQRGAFPLLFLAFMVPIPGVLLNPLISFLQSGSAHVVYGFFKLIGVPVFWEGIQFSLPGLNIEVAGECAGIRGALALLMTSFIAGYVFLETGWRRVILALCVIPFTIFSNALRILTLSLLGAYVHQSYLANKWLHPNVAIPFFALAIGFIATVLFILRKSEMKQVKSEGKGGRGLLRSWKGKQPVVAKTFDAVRVGK